MPKIQQSQEPNSVRQMTSQSSQVKHTSRCLPVTALWGDHTLQQWGCCWCAPLLQPCDPRPVPSHHHAPWSFVPPALVLGSVPGDPWFVTASQFCLIFNTVFLDVSLSVSFSCKGTNHTKPIFPQFHWQRLSSRAMSHSQVPGDRTPTCPLWRQTELITLTKGNWLMSRAQMAPEKGSGFTSVDLILYSLQRWAFSSHESSLLLVHR